MSDEEPLVVPLAYRIMAIEALLEAGEIDLLEAQMLLMIWTE